MSISVVPKRFDESGCWPPRPVQLSLGSFIYTHILLLSFFCLFCFPGSFRFFHSHNKDTRQASKQLDYGNVSHGHEKELSFISVFVVAFAQTAQTKKII